MSVGPLAIAMQNAEMAILTASGQTVYIYNRTYSGTPTASTFNEMPVLNISSGAYLAEMSNPNEKDVYMEAGYYIDEYKTFHIASGAIANQWDYLAWGNDIYVITEVCQWYIQGGQTRQRIIGRRMKVN